MGSGARVRQFGNKHMKRVRTIIVLLAMVITMLFAWQANSPAFARDGEPTCHGMDLLEKLKKQNPAAFNDLLERERQTPNGRGLLWQIQQPGTPPSWLFGTMHMSDERLTTLPGPVADALDEARTVVLELEEIASERKMQMAVIRNMGLLTFTDGRSLDNILSKPERQLLRSVLQKYGMPYAASRRMKPWFVMLSLSMPVCEMQRQKAGFKAVDAVIAAIAQKNGAAIVGLESVKEQFQVFASLDEEEQRRLLLSSLYGNDTLDDQIATMTRLYLQRRPAALWQFALYLNKSETGRHNGKENAKEAARQQNALKNFEYQLVTRRNKIMFERALPLLAKGSSFIAVGAAHLPGKQGLVALLKKAGYRLTKIY